MYRNWSIIDCEQSDLVRAIHARGSGEAATRAKRGRQPAISHARGHLRVSYFARGTTEKRETARSLGRLI